MKLTILLTLFTAFNVSASLYSQDTKLNLSVKDKTLKEVIKLIENQSNFRFFFSDDYLDLNRKVTITAQNKNINEVLTNLLYEGTVTYKVLENNVIVLTPASSQQTKVTGKVTDITTGEVLPGVNVLIKGTTRGVTTDIDGNFTMDVTNGEVLVFSYIGYLSEEVVFSGQTTVTIGLTADVQKLDEVVVVGYGTMKKRDLTGSVASLKAADIAESKSANVLQALQGKVAGVDITQSSGQAGSGVSINIRGNRSILFDNGQALVIVDGVEYGSTLDINPSDIESVDILKDGASTAIYGTRGANGVILITTKRGGEGKSKVTFNAYNAWNSPNFLPEIMTGQQYAQKRLETAVADAERNRYNLQRGVYNPTTGTVAWNRATNPEPWNQFGYYSGIDAYVDSLNLTRPANNQLVSKYQLITSDSTVLKLLQDGTNLDYLDMIFKNSTTQNYELGVTGGNEKTAINFSLGLMEDRGLLRRDLMRRYNFKIGVDQKVFKKLTVGANLLYTNKKNDKRSSGIFNQALKTGPVGVLYNDDGTYRQYSDTYFTTNQPNPMLDEVEGVYKNEIISHRVFASAYLNWEIIKGLVFRSNFGADINFERNGLFAGAKSLSRLAVGTPSTTVTHYDSWLYTWDNTLTFNKTVDNHSFQIMAGSSMTANQKEKFYVNGVGQIADKTEFYDMQGFASVSTVTPKDNYFTASQMLSYFGRLNYKFNEKYLFQFTYRTDGSSVLINKWHSFPSASIGWRVNEENFLKDINAISNLKLRASWGISGNAAINPYQSLTLVSDLPNYYTFGTDVFSAVAPSSSGAKSLDWEYTNTVDIGLDFGFVTNRISGSIDYFKSNTNKLLFYNPLPPSQVYLQVIGNIAQTENQGFEISLNTVNVKAGKFEWSTDWTYSMYKDKIVKLREDVQEVPNPNNSNELFRVDANVKTFYDYEKVGIYSIDDLKREYDYVAAQQQAGDSIVRGKIPMIANQFLPGDIKINDANGDGIFDIKDKRLYNESPKFTFGITNNFKFGNWGLRVLVIGRIGQYISYDFLNAYKPADLIVENGPYVDAWTPQNSGANFPRYYTSGNAKTYKTTLGYIDGSFVKIKDITLSYSLPQNILKYVKFSNLKLYGTLKNYFTFSKVDNFDPELGGTMNFPLAKQVIVGLNLEF